MVQSINQQRELSTDAESAMIRVAFQGERGAFGDEAVLSYFGKQTSIAPEPLPYRSFADVFRAVATGEVEYGLVPVENSQAGSINDVYRKALAIREQNLGLTHPNTASTYADLAGLYSTLERDEEAGSFYRKALSIREHAFGPDHPAVTRILEQLAVLLRKLKKEHEASEVEARIQAIRAKQLTHESS